MSRSQETIDKINRLLNHPSTHPNIKAAAQTRLDHINKTDSSPLHHSHSDHDNFHSVLTSHKYKPMFSHAEEINGEHHHSYEHPKHKHVTVTVISDNKDLRKSKTQRWYHDFDDKSGPDEDGRSFRGKSLDALHKSLKDNG